MDIQDQHTMVLVADHPDGSQEWHCPTCGRRFILYIQPSFKRVILEEGDFEVIHSGGMNGLNMGAATLQPGEAREPGEDLDNPGEAIEIDESYLEPFKAWMENRNER